MAGLDKVDALRTGQGYLEASAGVRGLWSGAAVGYLRGEAGYRLTPRSSLFGFGEATFGGQAPGWMAGVGYRVTW